MQEYGGGFVVKLLKALNNNVALVLDDKRMESVVMGRGVAFNVKVGQHINSSLVEKHFVLNGRGGRKDFDSLLKRITVNDIELASNIIREGELRLGYQCNDSILLTLSDHLGLMMERAREGIYIGTPLEWDIRLIYPDEYQYSKEVVLKLREKTGYEIPEQEAAFIALHFINANFSMSSMEKTMMYTKIIQNILNIARLFYGREFRDNNFDVSRFITHVRYFVRRQMDGESLQMDLDVGKIIEQKCPEDYRCAQKIAAFLKQAYGWDVGEGEVLYLALHLNRINQNI
jgi:Transcriptional antiterminator